MALSHSEMVRSFLLAQSTVCDRYPGREWDYFKSPHWQHPLMSPLVLRASVRRPDDAFFTRLARHFEMFRVERGHRYIGNFVTFYEREPRRRHGALIDAAVARKWEYYADTHLALWTNPVPYPIPSGFTVEVGPYYEPRLHVPFVANLHDHFNPDPRFRKNWDRLMRTRRKEVDTVIIRDRRDTVAAAGSVATHGEGALLLSGGVYGKFRGRGLWRVLLGVRQQLAEARGAKRFVYFTHHPFLVGKGEYNLHRHILLKRTAS